MTLEFKAYLEESRLLAIHHSMEHYHDLLLDHPDGVNKAHEEKKKHIISYLEQQHPKHVIDACKHFIKSRPGGKVATSIIDKHESGKRPLRDHPLIPGGPNVSGTSLFAAELVHRAAQHASNKK